MAGIFTERLVPDNAKDNIIYNEHLVRYELAKQFVKGKRVLDIACGTGYGAKILAEAGAAKVIAVDADKGAIEFAAKNYFHPQVSYEVGSAEQLAVPDKTIDVVVSFETIEHLKNQAAFLAELAKVVKDDGLVIVSTPNREASKNKNPFHIKELNREEFLKILTAYFSKVYLWEQINGLATVISGQDKTSGQGLISISARVQPEYFIALCSLSELPAGLEENIIASINPTALAVMRHNPILKLSDKIYSQLVKLPGAKRLLLSFPRKRESKNK